MDNRLERIRKMPTVSGELPEGLIGVYDPQMHESVFRAYSILELVKEMIADEVPHQWMAAIIEECEQG